MGAVPVRFSVPPVDGICGHDGTAGDLRGVFVVAMGTANNAGKASGVAGPTTGVVDVSDLIGSG